MASKTPNRNTCIVLLGCNHSSVFDAPTPEAGDEVFCRRCNNYSIVKDTGVEYYFKCRTCKYCRHFGMARINAELAAMRHRRKYSHHYVDIFHGTEKLHTFGPYEQLTIANAEIPPF